MIHATQVMRVCDTLMVCDAINIHLELTVTCPLPHARNHFVITTGFVATKVAERKVTEAKSDEERRRWSKLTSLSTPLSRKVLLDHPPRCVLASINSKNFCKRELLKRRGCHPQAPRLPIAPRCGE